ncbi:hypothetical protein [Hyphomonas sp.]|jgi:hypothetical protein|uniref:hypothetical protein n=1 Tax=Hyphomonas sp. TaxID=87 RepID=UPI000C95C582|nr:hypothetical protein [Hyphomonas sp.]MAL45642.1 hypothetical protein [Hyphomonas sp.]MAL45646.1 hypothetical protein [Hyphomonas sp.]|tara:strand:- start:595 stop:861 length:267 start_codon:yes stop_codon:yes gene_type:complete
MSKNKVVSDLKKIIKIQEKIIKAKEGERKQVHDLWIHYLEKSIEGWNWYGRYWLELKRLQKIINKMNKNAKVKTLIEKLNYVKGGSDE